MTETPADTKAEVQSVSIAWGSPFKAPTVQLASGQLITDASRVTIDCGTGMPPKIFLELPTDNLPDLKLEGVVYAVREAPADPIRILTEFLDAVDPSELDRCVLESMGMGGPQAFGEVALGILKGWARGD